MPTLRPAFVAALLLSSGACAPDGPDHVHVDGEGEGEEAGEGEGEAGEGEGDAGEGEGEGEAGEGEGEAGEGEGEGEAGTWRSRLYPADWAPGFGVDGLLLHDVSYAGYQGGEAPPDVEGPLVVVDGLDPTGALDATATIQQALDGAVAEGGGVVLLPTGLFRVDGLLTIGGSHVVLRGQGPEATRIFFTRATAMTDVSSLRVAGSAVTSARVLLIDDAPALATSVRVDDAAAFAVGDEVAVGFSITADYRAEQDMAVTPFADQWKAIHRRTLTAVDVATGTLHFDVPLREPVRVRDEGAVAPLPGLLREVGIEDLGLGNAVNEAAALQSDRAHVLELSGVVDAWVRDVASFAPPGQTKHLQSGGVLVADSHRVTVEDVVMRLAQHRGEGGNGYLVEVQRGNELLFADVTATDGRHNIIQNWDFGTSGCVFLRCVSSGSVAVNERLGVGVPAMSELHHSLARANLFDGCTFDDGWQSVNRGTESSGAGHAGSENILWNTRGGGQIKSLQRGQGYVIGTTDIDVVVEPGFDPLGRARNTAPVDFVEGEGQGAGLDPPSLYLDMRARRLARD